MENCQRCVLSETRNKVVKGEYVGSHTPNVMVIAEAPGPEEDRLGKPMKGSSGNEGRHHLMINGIHEYYLTNVMKCHPPGNRDPNPNEIRACLPYLQDELKKVNPDYIITMGAIATKTIFPDVSMEMVHGIPFIVGSKIVIPVYHPAAGMHDPTLTVMFHADMRMVGAIVKGKALPLHVRDTHYRKENYKLINRTSELDEFLDSDIIAVDTEWAQGKFWCLSLSIQAGRAGVVPHHATDSLRKVGKRLSEDVTAVIHNALYDLPVLAGVGIIPKRFADTMVMAYLLQNEPQALKVLAYRHCGMMMEDYNDVVGKYTHQKALDYLNELTMYEFPDPKSVLEWKKGEPHVRQPWNISKKIDKILEDATNKGADPYVRWNKIEQIERDIVEIKFGPMVPGELSDCSPAEWVYYSARDADATIRLYPILWDRVKGMELEGVFWRDMGMMPLVVDMMRNGMRIDREKFGELSAYFERRMFETLKKIEGIIGYPINPSSHPQVSNLLYDELQLHKGKYIKAKKAKTKKSTGIDVIRRFEHPVIEPIVDYREYHKLKTSYADVIPLLADEDDIVRPTARITRTTTGRISMSSPNLMAQPVRTEEGRLIRDGYVSKDGWTMVSMDYSQIEMKVAAVDAGDEVMLDIFRNNDDIHTKTALFMFKIPESDVEEMAHRYPAKRTGFGVLNLITAKGLQREIAVAKAGAWTVSECQDMIDAWFDLYKGIAAYMKGTINHARRYGYVRDMWGRVRYIPNIKSPNRWLKAKAENQAGNAPIQMGAQGIIKQAMWDLVPIAVAYRDVMVAHLQIHDDLVFSIRDDAMEWLIPIIKSHMEGAAPPGFGLPLEVDVKVGKRWGSMQKYSADYGPNIPA